MKTGYVVKYRVAGEKEERVTPTYPNLRTAQEHADDIRGFERIEYAVVGRCGRGTEVAVPRSKRQKVAGPWMGIDGSDVSPPVTREDISGPEGEIGITLAMVYPTCVYVRTFFGQEWKRVKSRDAADRVLRRAGWQLT